MVVCCFGARRWRNSSYIGNFHLVKEDEDGKKMGQIGWREHHSQFGLLLESGDETNAPSNLKIFMLGNECASDVAGLEMLFNTRG